MRQLAVYSFLAILLSGSALSAQEAERHFYRGFYLQEQGDRAAALEQYQAALEAEGAEEIQARVLEQLDKMSEAIVAADMARLMPADVIGYIEIAQPGDHIEKLAGAMGLVGRQEELSNKERVVIELDDGLEIASDFQLSPALVNELKKISGLAIGITGLNHEEEHPEGVIVIHAGESDLIRGLIETGIQVVPRRESIGGCETFCIEDEMWFVKKGSLIVGSESKSQIQDVLQRMESGESSLAQDAMFQKEKADREDALFFAYLNGPGLMKQIGPHLDDEAAVARVVLGIDRIRGLTASLRATDSGAAAQLRCQFDEGYQGLAYGLIKTSPLKDDLLRKIPAGAAVVAALGINPQLVSMAGMNSGSREMLSALDVGRELFANIKDVGLFVLPAIVEGRDEVPEFGFAISANDADRSEQLWHRILELPAKMGESDELSVTKISMGGREANKYTFDDEDAPELIVLRLDETTMLVGTEGAVELAVATADGRHDSLENDTALASLVKQRSEHTAKAIIVHAGRAMELGALLEGGDEKELAELRQVSQVLGATRVVLTSDEGPDEFKLRVEAHDLPIFEKIVRSLANGRNDQISENSIAQEE
jgi:tetratricopeptide (TPR) repeat protein